MRGVVSSDNLRDIQPLVISHAADRGGGAIDVLR